MVRDIQVNETKARESKKYEAYFIASKSWRKVFFEKSAKPFLKTTLFMHSMLQKYDREGVHHFAAGDLRSGECMASAWRFFEKCADHAHKPRSAAKGNDVEVKDLRYT